MKTSEVIKKLEESKEQFGNIVFETQSSDGIMFCYLRPNAGSLEFLFYDYNANKYNHTPIVYLSDDWQLSDRKILLDEMEGL